MGIEWTREALDALATGIYGERQTYEPDKLRAALDAAVKAQGLVDAEASKRFAKAHGNLIRAEALEDAAAWFEGKGGVIPGASVFARLLSRNNQPCMSGDPRDRLNRLDRREFDEAMGYVAERLRALKDKPANQTEGGE